MHDPLASITRLPVTRRADQVVDRVRALIVDEALAVGDRLPAERMLAERFGTSRAIVSQALRMLSLMGLVEIRPGSGAYVTRNPTAMLHSSFDLLVQTQAGPPDDIAELRHLLETAGATRALTHGSEEDLELCATMLERMRASEGRLSSWVVADTDFHAAIVRASGNPYLAALHDSVHTAVLSVTYDAWVASDAAPRWFTEDLHAQLALHGAILDALRAGDRLALHDALEAHHRALLDHLSDRSG